MLKKFTAFKRDVEIQRKNSFFLIDEINDTSMILPYEHNNTYCNYYLFPIRFESKEERDSVSDILRDKSIDTSKLYHLTPLKAKQYYGYKGDCANAEQCSDTILVIPNHYTLNQSELSKVAQSVKEAA